jgi:hypothetical protein
MSPASSLWCWHQHGWNHSNHEAGGRKCEFGPSRDSGAIQQDLARGRRRLADLMGELFLPVFTPPWNRCSQATLDALLEQGFHAVSRSASANPVAPPGLPDLAVNVDLHTRRENNAPRGWSAVLQEISRAAAGGRIGFMIHHQRMNDSAFAFLELLLDELRTYPAIRCVTFRDILGEITSY